MFLQVKLSAPDTFPKLKTLRSRPFNLGGSVCVAGGGALYDMPLGKDSIALAEFIALQSCRHRVAPAT